MYRLRRFIRFDHCQRLRSGHHQQNNRNIYSGFNFGITEYETNRKEAAERFDSMQDAFKRSIEVYIKNDQLCMYTLKTDFKDLMHLVDNTKSDIDLLIQVLRKINKEHQNGNDYKKTFIFGTNTMRVFHYYQLDDVAIRYYDDPELKNVFNQKMSGLLLLDLLYKKKRYADVIRIWMELEEIDRARGNEPFACKTILVVASWYHQNTRKGFEDVCKLLKNSEQLRRTYIFAAGLALKQNEPETALQIIDNIPNQNNHKCLRNMKIMAFNQMRRFGNILVILRPTLETTDKDREDSAHVFSTSVISKVHADIKNSGNKTIVLEFNRILDQLKAMNCIVEETLDSMICSAFAPKSRPIDNKDLVKASFESNNRSTITSSKRPGLNEFN